MRASFLFLIPLTLMCLAFSKPGQAITPQTGIYWNPQYPGWAIYIESQRNTVFAIVYAYSEVDREPEFFISSGPLLADVPVDLDSSYAGLFPIAGFGAPLFRVPAGSCLGCVYSPIAPSERIGNLQMSFVTKGYILVQASFLDGRRFPNPGDQFGLPFERFNFSLGGTLERSGDRSPAWPELLGEWVFTDQTDRQRAAWRFEFASKEEDVNLGSFPILRSVVYRDESRNAVFYCFITDPSGLTLEQRNALPDRGCEVRQNGTPLFWSQYELVIDEFVGSMGPLPPRGAKIYRSPQRVVGRRISD